MLNEHEKRRFQRSLYSAKANLFSAEKSWDCHVIDLSLNGCLVNFKSPWQESLENFFTLSLNLPNNIEVKMRLKPAHHSRNHVGFKCEAIDAVSVDSLRKMLKSNSGKDEILERDLSSLAVLSYN